MYFPTATRKTAFLAGLSLIALIGLLDLCNSLGLISHDADSPELFPLVLAYFFVTGVILVIGVRNLAPKELKTKIPLVYFPTNREGVRLLFRIWGRMLIWFLGAATGGLIMSAFVYLATGKL